MPRPKHLTPVTLELGGKSPCIVDRHTDLQVAARRIVWGKFYNAGQTCVAPDYVLAHKEIEEPLLAKLKQTLHEFFGDDPHAVGDYGRIINARHYERLMSLLRALERSSPAAPDLPADRYIAPTILRNTSSEAPVMASEIFGPILPVLKVQDVEHAIAFVNSRAKPLALYVFTNDRGRAGQSARQDHVGRCDRQPHAASPGQSLAAVRRSRPQRHGGLSRKGHVRDVQPQEIGARQTDVAGPVVLLSAVQRRQEVVGQADHLDTRSLPFRKE